MSYNKINNGTRVTLEPRSYKRTVGSDAPISVFKIREHSKKGNELDVLFKVLGVKMKSPRQGWTYRAHRRNYALGRFDALMRA